MGIIASVKPVRSAVELEFIGNEIAEPVHPLSRAFLDLWHSKHHGTALPSRDEFSMSELRYFLPHLLIAEPVKAYRDFFYRFAGSQLEERAGFRFQGRTIREAIAPPTCDDVIGRYVTAITSSRPLFRRGRFRISDFETGFIITSILPIFSPDRTAHWIFAALIPETVRLPIR